VRPSRRSSLNWRPASRRHAASAVKKLDLLQPRHPARVSQVCVYTRETRQSEGGRITSCEYKYACPKRAVNKTRRPFSRACDRSAARLSCLLLGRIPSRTRRSRSARGKRNAGLHYCRKGDNHSRLQWPSAKDTPHDVVSENWSQIARFVPFDQASTGCELDRVSCYFRFKQAAAYG